MQRKIPRIIIIMLAVLASIYIVIFSDRTALPISMVVLLLCFAGLLRMTLNARSIND